MEKIYSFNLSFFFIYQRCGHCKSIAPSWEKLASVWDGHEIGLIAEVDCTSEGKTLCEANGIEGFPTLKFGNPLLLEDYEGGRDYDNLAEFAQENIKPICSMINIHLCSDEEKKEIEWRMNMSDNELQAAIDAEEEKITNAETHFELEVAKLQESFNTLISKKDAIISAVKKNGLGIMKMVKSVKTRQKKNENLSDEL